MLSFFKRKAPPGPPTFNERVSLFWTWFQGVASRFYETIEAGQCPSLAEETSQKVDQFLPGFQWVFGPGENGIGHSFTLTGEGNIHRQLLALHWLSQAPKIEGWTFYAARQPGPISGHCIEMDGVRFDPKEVWVTPEIDTETSTVHVNVWHPSWEHLPENRKSTVTFLFLDEALGEYGTDWWIGRLTFGRDRLADSFPIEELSGYIANVVREKEWKKYPPGESWTLYKIKKIEGNFPRSDLFSLSTAVPRLFTEYMDAAGELPDPLKDTGADYVYASITQKIFPKENGVAERGKIEDALDAALKRINGGRIVSGAFGSDRAYIDMLIFDGARSLDAIKGTLREKKLPSGTMIEFFAREKRAQRIAL